MITAFTVLQAVVKANKFRPLCCETPDPRSDNTLNIAVRIKLIDTGTHVPYWITQCYLPPCRNNVPAFTPPS